MKRIAVIGFDGFTDVDLVLPYDLLSRVDGLEVRIVAETPTIRSHTGLELHRQAPLRTVREADGVFVASGPGTRAWAVRPDLAELLPLDPQRQLLCALDSGALLLAALGHLRGLEATTYPSPDLYASLQAHGASPVRRGLVTHERIATAAQCLGGVELVRWLATKLTSAGAANAAIETATMLPD